MTSTQTRKTGSKHAPRKDDARRITKRSTFDEAVDDVLERRKKVLKDLEKH